MAYRVFEKIQIILEMIKFPHTVFALPFAIAGAILAADGIPSWNKLSWVIVAMVGARSGVFGLNRLIDKKIDAKNPRTMNRALPRGLIREREVVGFVIFSFLLFLLAAFMLNPLCVKLYPVALTILFVYSFMKRITWATHLVLGLAIGIAPVGAWIAISGNIRAPALILSLAVISWVAGFDIIYACQDTDFDRQSGLHSIPQWLGIKRGLKVAMCFHLFTVILLILLYFYSNLSFIYLIGVAITLILLIYEHSIISEADLSRIGIAFFNVNAVVSISILFFIFIDRLVL